MKRYYVYVLASGKNGTLYIGVTDNISRRTEQHKQSFNKSFTSKYKITGLVYYEETSDIEAAIRREKQLKHWNRDWKIELIEKYNPNWEDLSDEHL